MKNTTQNLFIGIALVIILLSCSQSGGDVYLGTWKNDKNVTFIITKAGETAYTVVEKRPDYDPAYTITNTITATFKDGNLVVGNVVCFSYSDGKLICSGKEYEKVK